MRWRLPALDDQGFSVVEVMVAALVLVVGVLGVLTTIEQAQTGTWSVQARSGATALAREVDESARAIPYEQLVNSTIASRLQSQADLGDDELGTPGWQIRRSGFTYTVTAGVCTVDDPRDGLGNHDANQFCATGMTGSTAAQCSNLLALTGGNQLPGATRTAADVAGLGDCGLDVNGDGQVDGLLDTAGTTCTTGCTDTGPADAKRVVVLVRWDRGMGARYVLQGTTAVNPGLAAAPSISGITPSTPSPVTSSGVTSVTMSVTTSSAAEAVGTYVDGTQQAGGATGSGTAWSFTWPLGTVSSGTAPNAGEVVDGSYLVGAKAYDDNSQFGQSRTLTMVVNRRAPYPPQGLQAGRNGTAVELQWQPAVERDIERYRVYKAGTGSLVCDTTNLGCQDTSPPSGTPSYEVVAVDRNTSGNLREGARSAAATADSDDPAYINHPPAAPGSLVATSSGGSTVLTWTASAGDPDAGDKIDHYTIYRDGTTYADRYDRTQIGTQLTWTDTRTNGQAHTYYVTAVDTHLAESAKIGPVTK